MAGQGIVGSNALRFTGEVRMEQFNLAGIKTAEGIGFRDFDNVDQGIEAICQHHLAYTLGEQREWPLVVRERKIVKPRLDAVLELFPRRVTMLGDYGGGLWGEDPKYASKIARMARRSLETRSSSERPSLSFPETRKFVGGGFKACSEELGERGPQALRLPVTNEALPVDLDKPSKRVQVFERGVLAWSDEFHYPWDVVCLKLPDAQRTWTHFEEQGVV